MATWSLLLTTVCLALTSPTSAQPEPTNASEVNRPNLKLIALGIASLKTQYGILLNNDEIEASNPRVEGRFEMMDGIYCYVTGESMSTRSLVYLYDQNTWTLNSLKNADALADQGGLFVVMPDYLSMKIAFDRAETILKAPQGRSLFGNAVDKFLSKFCDQFPHLRMCNSTETQVPIEALANAPVPPIAAPTPAPAPPPPVIVIMEPESRPSECDLTDPAHKMGAETLDALMRKLVAVLENERSGPPGILGVDIGANAAAGVVARNPNLFRAGVLVSPFDMDKPLGECGVEFPLQVYYGGSESRYPRVNTVLKFTFKDEIVHRHSYEKASRGFFAPEVNSKNKEDKKAAASVIAESAKYFRRMLPPKPE